MSRAVPMCYNSIRDKMVAVRQEYCRAHHLTGNYRTASDTWIQVSTNRNASPWRRLHWRHDDRKMTSQWCARTFGGVTREVSSYIMMHMHGGFGKPRSFPHQLICVTPPKVRAHHCDVIFRSSWRQCRRRQGEAFLFVDTWIQVSLAVL